MSAAALFRCNSDLLTSSALGRKLRLSVRSLGPRSQHGLHFSACVSDVATHACVLVCRHVYMYVRIYVYMCIYVYLHTYIDACVARCLHVYMYVDVEV